MNIGERFELAALRVQCLIDAGRYREAEEFTRNLAAQVSTGDDENTVALLVAQRLARLSRARIALREAYAVMRREHSRQAEAKARWIAGVALYRAGHYRWSQQHLELSLAYYRLSGERTNAAMVLENIALVLKNRGRTEAAMECLDQAVAHYSGRRFWRLRSYCQLHRGIVFLRQGNIESARVALVEAKRLARGARQAPVAIASDNHLGHIYRMEGNYETALEFHREAFEMSRREGFDRKKALALEFVGETLVAAGQASDAIPVLDDAMRIALPLAGRGDLVMEILRRRGEARIAIGDKTAGVEDLRQAVALCRARGEVREALLSQRAFCFATAASASELEDALEQVFVGLRRVGDRFECARTVCLASEDPRLAASTSRWLHDARASAAHYLVSMGLTLWTKRLQSATGQSVRIVGGAPQARPNCPGALQTQSPRFNEAIAAANVAARSSDPALILGETGSGKEVIARYIHEASARADRPLMAVNCGAIPATLIESELFGHVRGAFTGAERDRAGLFENAEGGTVLLDEIGDLPADVQVKLLRFLDHYQFHRVGEHRSRNANVRILAATHKDMLSLVDQGLFRADLYYRLNVFAVELPPLRDRREDIPGLIATFLSSVVDGDSALRPTPDLQRWMEAYTWPGNVRELRNLCRYLAVRCWGKQAIDVNDLPIPLRATCVGFLNGAVVSVYERERVDLERVQITSALQKTQGNIREAGALLGMHRNVVSRRMREHGLDRKAFLPRR